MGIKFINGDEMVIWLNWISAFCLFLSLVFVAFLWGTDVHLMMKAVITFWSLHQVAEYFVRLFG